MCCSTALITVSKSPGLLVATGTARSSTHVTGGNCTGKSPPVPEINSSALRRSSNSCSISLMRRLKPMSATGEPGRVPRKVAVIRSWPKEVPRWTNQVWRCTSLVSCRKDVGKSMGSSLHRSSKRRWRASTSKCSASKKCRTSIPGCPCKKINSRSMWWKAARTSTKMTAELNLRDRATWPCTRKTWDPVTVCSEGKPPNCPFDFRCCKMGSSLPRTHAWNFLPYTSSKTTPL